MTSPISIAANPSVIASRTRDANGVSSCLAANAVTEPTTTQSKTKGFIPQF
jgi:hypothetical protein